MIAPETIEDIKNNVRLIDVISRRVELRQRGLSYTGLCPFHQEKTPSFHVRESDNYYHCFGCGASGNVITFVMESEGLSFPEAVEQLAQRFGINVKYTSNTRKPRAARDKRDLFKITGAAQAFYASALGVACRNPGSRIARYIQERAITAEAIKTFGIGYAPAAWNDLARYFAQHKIPEDRLIESGLAKRSAKGELYDVFRARLVFPVLLDSGRVAGFGGRLIPGLLTEEQAQTAPKYLNSPESAIYQKSRILYGLTQALNQIRTEREFFLVEGYLDVISLWQVGIKNVLATCGTAVTKQHARRMSGLADRAYLLFDGDAAGRSAAARAFEAFVNSGIDVSAIFLPEDEDPDTIAKLHGSATKEYLEGLKSETKSLLECVLDALLTKYGVQSIKDLGAAQKGKLCEELSRSLSLVESKIEQAELISKAALKLMVERVHLEALVLGKTDAGQIFLNVEIEAEPGPETQDGAGSYRNIKDLPQLDRAILQAVIAKKEVLAEEVIRDADIMGEVCEDTRLFVEGLAQTINLKGASLDEKKELIKSLLSEFGPSWFAFWRQTHRILKDESVNVDKLFAECRKAVRRAQLKRALAQLDREISECDAEEVREELLQEKLEMGRRLNAV